MVNFNRNITIWSDETEFEIEGKKYQIIGGLITGQDESECDFLAKLKRARASAPCFNTLHAKEINPKKKDHSLKWKLLQKWINCFLKDKNVSFYFFAYPIEKRWMRFHGGYLQYYANQTATLFVEKLKWLNKDTNNINLICDQKLPTGVETMNAEKIYKEIILERMNKAADKMYWSDEITKDESEDKKRRNVLRVSFVNDQCFDAMQLCDCLLNIILQVYLKGSGEEKYRKEFADIFYKKIAPKLGVEKLLSLKSNRKFNCFDTIRN